MAAEPVLEAPFAELWAGQDPFVAVEALQGQVFRELEGRRTLRTEVAGRGYFVKIHRGIGWREIFKNLLSLRLPVLGANPAREHSFIVTEELAPTVSLEDFCRDWPQQPPSPVLKRALIARVADMAGRMHRAGVNHRDFYICHFLLHVDPAPTPTAFRLSIIDLHRAQCRTATPRRWRDKDLAALYFSALEIGLTRRDWLRFLRGYFERPLRDILRDEAPLLRHLLGEGERLLERYRRKYAPGAVR